MAPGRAVEGLGVSGFRFHHRGYYQGRARHAILHSKVLTLQGTSLIRNSAPSQDHHRALGISLLKGPRRALFLRHKVASSSSLLLSSLELSDSTIYEP